MRRLIAMALAGLAGCQQGAAPPTPPAPPGGEPRATACGVTQPPESWRTRLRGEIKTPDPRGRATLADKQVEPTLTSLRAALASDDQTRLLATLTAISVMDCRVLVPDVEQRMKGLPAPVVVEAAATLIELGRSQPGVAALKAALADASWPTVQLTAAQYLARADDRSGLPVVRAALASDQEAIRLQALQTAPVFAGGGLDVIAVLEAAVRSDSSWLVRREATEMLARHPRTERIAAVLAHVAANDSDEQVRGAARRGLAAP